MSEEINLACNHAKIARNEYYGFCHAQGLPEPTTVEGDTIERVVLRAIQGFMGDSEFSVKERLDYRLKPEPKQYPEIKGYKFSGEVRPANVGEYYYLEPGKILQAYFYSSSHFPIYIKDPPKKKIVPLEMEDFIGVWWVKTKEVNRGHHLITFISSMGIECSNKYLNYQSLKDNCLRSQDQINWTPCHKEVEV